jgi:Tfp pilus assembly protein PilO
MKLTKREEFLLFFALLLVSLILLYNYVYSPINKKNDELKNKSSELTSQIDEYKIKEASIQKMQAKLTELQKELSTQYEDIPKFLDQPELLYYLETAMGKLCISETVNFYDPVDTGAISGEEIGLQFKSDYDDLQKFLKALEAAKYFNTVQSVSITKNTENFNETDDKVKELEVNIILRFYSNKEDLDYPDNYEFLDKTYGKKDIFKEKAN